MIYQADHRCLPRFFFNKSSLALGHAQYLVIAFVSFQGCLPPAVFRPFATLKPFIFSNISP